LVSVAGGNSQDNAIDVLKNASEFEKSRIFGIIFLTKFMPRELDDNISNETSKFKTP